jgi:hypothetical protein
MSRESWIIRIDSDPPARMVATVNNRIIPADAIESEANALYLAGANLVQIPDLAAMINDVGDRIEIGLNGVTPEVMALAKEEASQVIGSSLHIGRIEFDDAWQIKRVVWLRHFRIDKITVGRQVATVGSSPSRSITLSLGTGNTGRSNAPNTFFTPLDQKRRSPGDLIFDHVPAMSIETSRRFGVKGS